MNNNAEFKTLYKVLAALSFLIVFIALTIGSQPSVPFWDCGERLAMMRWQQICHPPGTPLFSIIGAIVNVLVPFGNVGWHGNMISVTASSLTVMFLFFIAVLVIKNLRKDPVETLTDALAVYGSAFVGALGFGFSATLWFNGVESEVYATSILTVSIVIYLLMRWTTVADEPDNERYLLVCLYLTALSMGVHFLGTLSLFTIILVVYFRKYEVTPKTFLCLVIAGVVSYVVVLDMIAQGLPAYLSGHTTTRTEAMEFTIQNSGALQVLTVLLILGIVYWFIRSYKKKKPVQSLISFALILVIFCFSIYSHVLIRAHANPPMSENSPKTFSVLGSYIRREQYGTAPIWPRRYQSEDYFIRCYNKQDNNGNYVYGQWNEPGRKIVQRKDGSQMYATDWNNVNTGGELSYMWKYQASHMYFRYLFWNFVGRMSNVQDEGVAWFDTRGADEANYKTGNEGVYPIRYFGLPLLFGLIGLYYHFKRNPKNAFIFLSTFLVFGVVLALYQNQQEPQPRERDYFYVGSFLIWGLWMCVGTYALISMLVKKRNAVALTSVLLLISFVLVPFNMAYSTIPAYSRDGKWLTFDYAYNVLQSLAEDAILFTNGDNDTFCVWYMQDVEGVRRDVRVANLSLGQTLWYVNQLKNMQPWGAKKVPISFSDESLQVEDEYSETALSYEFGAAKTDKIAVDKSILAQFTNDANIINNGSVTMTFVGKENRKDDKGNPLYFFGVNHKLVRDVIITNKFERPVYFISSAGSDAMCGLERYMRTEGLCKRICPVPQNQVDGNDAYNEEVMDALINNIDNTDAISKTQKYGFKFRNLSKESICYEETDRRTVMMSYPGLFIGYATYLAEVKNDYERAQKVMDAYLTNIPLKKFPLPSEFEARITSIYQVCGNTEKSQVYARIGIKSCEEQIANENLDPQVIYYEQIGRYYGPYQICADLYKIIGEWDKAKAKLEQLATKMQVYQQQVQQSGDKEGAMQLGFRVASLRLSVELLVVDKLEQEGNYAAALEEVKKLETKLSSDEDPYSQYFLGSMMARRNDYERKLGLKTTADTSLLMNAQ
ncbi:MAG: DUF2723 domain-containing protein [Ignavibacteria bacterium]|jgi:tetratricopeptide (TPR) repeat protein|nr:DUF2723 domain-containing protein [Ignavibacteria bacterium]